MSGVRAEEITTSRLTTHVLESGSSSAPPLVLVHGNVSAAAFFAPLMADLADRYHCIAPDLRGFGRSERKPVDARRGLRDFSDDVHALVLALTEAGRLSAETAPVLLGWSLGGGVVMQYAIDHPADNPVDSPGAARALVLESPMAPFGFGGTRDAAGTPCYPDFAGSGGGTANPEMVRRLGAGDRTDEDLVSPRRVLTNLYGQPPFERCCKNMQQSRDRRSRPRLCCRRELRTAWSTRCWRWPSGMTTTPATWSPRPTGRAWHRASGA